MMFEVLKRWMYPLTVLGAVTVHLVAPLPPLAQAVYDNAVTYMVPALAWVLAVWWAIDICRMAGFHKDRDPHFVTGYKVFDAPIPA